MEIPYVIKKDGMYYAHGSAGYVSRVVLAEIYTKAHTKREEKHCSECEAIPITELLTGADEVQAYIDRMEIMRDAMKAQSA